MIRKIYYYNWKVTDKVNLLYCFFSLGPCTNMTWTQSSSHFIKIIWHS